MMLNKFISRNLNRNLNRFAFNKSIYRNFSSSPHPPTLTKPIVSKWLYSISGLIAGIVVIGGMTRLTESGLSITEWKPITGVYLPKSQQEWQDEFDKYKLTPEFKLMNSRISLEDFKKIYLMEWAHRLFGRGIGIAFLFPSIYFFYKRQLSKGMKYSIGGLGLGLGFQGFLGWYMVQSGLKDENFVKPGSQPRVSQYRLSAHLGAALALYVGTLYSALAVGRDWSYGFKNKGISGLTLSKDVESVLTNNNLKLFKLISRTGLGVVFLTALSGAFVAGLDAGLIYNEFPMMGEGLTPPLKELFNDSYSQKSDRSDLL